MRRADLNPPLGKPGGLCQIVERMQQHVQDPHEREELIRKLEQGETLDNAEASEGYPHEELEVGTGYIRSMLLGYHTQYRMDLRRITVAQVRQALGGYVARHHAPPAIGEKIEFIDPITKLEIVFVGVAPGRVKIVTVMRKGSVDPIAPGHCPNHQRLAGRYLQRCGYTPPVNERTTPEYPTVRPLRNDNAPTEDNWMVRPGVPEKREQVLPLPKGFPGAVGKSAESDLPNGGQDPGGNRLRLKPRVVFNVPPASGGSPDGRSLSVDKVRTKGKPGEEYGNPSIDNSTAYKGRRPDVRAASWDYDWDPQKSLYFIVGDKKAKVGEGNHRLALARALGLSHVPVEFEFVAGAAGAAHPHPEVDEVPKPSGAGRNLLPNLLKRRSAAAYDPESWYYDWEPGMTLQDVLDRWQKQRPGQDRRGNKLPRQKLYDRDMPQWMDTSEIWHYREYTWTRENGRDGYARVNGQTVELPGPLKWDAILADMKQNGWDPEDPLHLHIGSEGGVKVGEGNHRLAIARKLGMPKVPVEFHFQTGRVVKSTQFKDEPVALAPKVVERAVIEEKAEPRTPEEEQQISEIMGLLFGKWAAIDGSPYPSTRQKNQQSYAKNYYRRYYRKNKQQIKRRMKKWWGRQRTRVRVKLDRKRRQENPNRFTRKPGGGYRHVEDRARDWRENKSAQATGWYFYTPTEEFCRPISLDPDDGTITLDFEGETRRVLLREVAVGYEVGEEGASVDLNEDFIPEAALQEMALEDDTSELMDHLVSEPRLAQTRRVADFYMEIKEPHRRQRCDSKAGTPSGCIEDTHKEEVINREPDRPRSDGSPGGYTYNNPGSARVIPEGHDFVNKRAAVVPSYAEAIDRKGIVLKPGDYISAPLYPRGTIRGWVVLHPHQTTQWIDPDTGRAHWIPSLSLETEDGNRYSFSASKSVKLPDQPRAKAAALISQIENGTADNLFDKSRILWVKLKRVDQKNAMWTFHVQGSKGPYVVKVQVSFPRKGMTDPEKADVKLACSCPFWRWQGPEHHAAREGYLYGKPRGTASVPEIQDPTNTKRLCKHVIAALARFRQFSMFGSRTGALLARFSAGRVAGQYFGDRPCL